MTSAYFDLGRYSRAISNTSEDAQMWFDRGLMWIYGFNHEEAITCFRHALDADPDCAMAYWGIAYAIGPNYNKPWEDFSKREATAMLFEGAQALSDAQRMAKSASAAERALIEALTHRYPVDMVEDFAPWNNAYSNEMRELYKNFPDDLDITALFAEALMNRTPWQLWDLRSETPADGADTEEVIAILERAFADGKRGWDHPGLLHMYIHVMEMSPHPERALRHGDRLGQLVPDAGHLQHMASHIDVLCGDYHNVVTRNAAAVVADRKFLDIRGTENFYSFYRIHDYHFLVYGAMFLGQPDVALDAADELVRTMPKHSFEDMADWFEPYVPIRLHVLIRFGRWRDILTEPLPQDPHLYAMTTAITHYARAVALANLRRPSEAREEAAAFMKARERVPCTRMLFNNSCHDLLDIAEHMMLGELDYHEGKLEQAFEHLRRSVALDDNLPYDEPWGWMQPTRHALGALLLEQGRMEEAEAVYRTDLGLDPSLPRPCQHPANLWSLLGLHECLKRRGENVEIAHVAMQLDQAMARASIPVKASCFCRKTSGQEEELTGSR